MVPASPSALLEEEPWLISRLCGLTRLTAKDEDHWEEEDRVEGKSFCDDIEGEDQNQEAC